MSVHNLCPDCGFADCRCPSWVYVDLGEDTHANLGAAGSMILKQRNGSAEDAVHLSPAQVYMLEQLFRSGEYYPERNS